MSHTGLLLPSRRSRIPLVDLPAQDAGAGGTVEGDGAEAAAVPVASDSCTTAPCLVTDRTVDISVDAAALWFLRSFGQEGRTQLLKRGAKDVRDVEVSHDVRPSPSAHVYRMQGDKEILALATSEGLAIWNKAQGGLTMLSPQPKGVHQVAFDADAIYFMGSDCILKKIPRAGGNVMELAKAGGERFCALPKIAVDGSDVYFAPNDTVYAVPRAGGKTRVIFSGRNRYVLGLAIDDDVMTERGATTGLANVYLLLSPPQPQMRGTSPRGLLLKTPKRGGGPAIELATPEPSGNAYTLVSDAANVYWLESNPKRVTVASMDKAGKSRRVLAESDGMGYGIARGPESIYWVRWIMSGGNNFPDVFRMALPPN